MRSWEQKLSDLLHTIRLDTIRRKIITFALLATLIPSLTMGWLSYTQSKQTQAEKTSAELRSGTSHAAQGLNLWLQERRHEVKVYSNSYEVTENLEKSFRGQSRGEAVRRLQAYLKAVQRRFADYYEELVVLDRHLRVLATSAGKPSPLQLPEDWLQVSKPDAPVVGQPHWDADRMIAVMMIGVPVRASDGRLLGALAAKVNFLTVENQLRTASVANTGRVYVIARDGTLIIASHPLPSAFMKTKLSPTAVQSLFDHEGSSVEYRDYEGEAVMGMLKPVSVLDWGVVAEISQAQVFAQTIKSRNLTLLMVSALLLSIGFMAYVLGLTIVRPLERLADGAAEVASGDLEVDVPVLSRGEAGYLTNVFNDMVARLRQGRDELAATNSALSEKNKELERLSITDSLTGLYNRKRLMETLAHEASRYRRHFRPFSVMMLDLDHFKRYNDTYGHLEGDRLLAKVASIFRDTMRTLDFVARYGGEEFLIVLPETNGREALQAAERIRKKMAAETAKGEESKETVTLSIGVASFPQHGETPTAIIQSADEALYKAKRAGRNRAVLAANSAKAGHKAPAFHRPSSSS